MHYENCTGMQACKIQESQNNMVLINSSCDHLYHMNFRMVLESGDHSLVNTMTMPDYLRPAASATVVLSQPWIEISHRNLAGR